jgi:type IV pilus assembly protein PilA
MKSTKCGACGFVGFSDETCKACGAPLNQRATNPPSVAPVYTSHSYESWGEPESQKKGMAIFAMVLGILSFFTFGILGIGAITGIVLACVAMSRAKHEPWKYGGRGMAIAGLVLCAVSLVMVVPMGIVASIAIPNLLASRRAANEASAVHSVRAILAAEANFQSAYNKFGTLDELRGHNMLEPKLAKGEKHGYQFSVSVTGPETFEVSAVPTVYRSTGLRSFYVDETAVIRAGDNYGGPSSKMDEPLEMSYGHPQRSNRRVDYRNNY